MAFVGFPDEAFEFFEGLKADNSKAYWQAHKGAYESAVKAPMVALLEELSGEFGEWRMFRPYRDVRFSADKSPYKTHQGGHTAGFYVEVNADGLVAAAGAYAPGPQELARFRSAVDSDLTGPVLESRIAVLREKGFEIAGERLKTRPRGVPEDHPRLDLLRHRSLYATRHWPPEDWVGTAAAADRIRQAWRDMRPLQEWMSDHVRVEQSP